MKNNDNMYQALMERLFKTRTKPETGEVCAVCGETPVQPVEVMITEYNLKKLCCRGCIEKT